MATKSVSQVVTEILSADLSLTADQVIAKAKGRGLKASDDSIRAAVYNARTSLKRAAANRASGTPQPSPASKPTQAQAKPKPTSPALKPKAALPKPAAPAPQNLSALFATVELVTKVVDTCGGAANTRQAAEAVRKCGGVDAFLKHVELVEGIRKGA